MPARFTVLALRLATIVIACLILARDARATDSIRTDGPLGRYTVQRLRVPMDLPERFELVVVLDDAPAVLRLERHSLRAPGFRVREYRADGRQVDVAVPAPATYRGYVDGVVPIPVVADLRADGLNARVDAGAGVAWTIRPVSGEERATGQALHRVAPEDTASPSKRFDGCEADAVAPAMPSRFGESGAAPISRHTGQHQTEIAFDLTHSFYEAYGSTVATSVAAMEAIMNQVDFMYARDLMITYTITHTIVRTSIFYTGGTFLGPFTAEWNANQTGVQRDVAHLLFVQPDGSLAGSAPQGVICDVSAAYGSSTDHPQVVAHELGHNWNTTHCHDSSPCNSMCGGCLLMTPNTKDIILEFRDTLTCLDDAGAYSQVLPPYAHPERTALTRNDIQAQVTRTFDILANDHDGNLDPLSLDGFDATSEQGGAVILSPGTGGGGADELVYTAAGTVLGGDDRFTYTVGDGTGQQTAGDVNVRVAAPALLGYWKLDEGAGNQTADSSGAQRSGTINGAVWDLGRFGNGLVFDGPSDDVFISSLNAELEAMTVATWLKRDGTQDAEAGIVFVSGFPSRAGLIFVNGVELGYRWGDDPATYTWGSGLTVPPGRWVFAALVVEPHQATIYLHDGLSMQSAVNSVAHGFQYFHDPIHLGWNPVGLSARMLGALDEVRLYDYALDAADVAELQQQGGKAFAPNPRDGGRLVTGTSELTWSAGLQALSHDVYFGTDYVAVRDATTASPEYLGNLAVTSATIPVPVLHGVTYYWRVDEIGAAGTAIGDVWLFTRGSLWAHWKLDETSGLTAFDAKGNFDGTYVGGVQLDQSPPLPELGRSVLFDGINDSVQVPALNLDADELTITAWLRRDGQQSPFAGIVYSRAGSTVAGLSFGELNELRYNWNDAGYVSGTWHLDSGLVVPDDTWVFTALVVQQEAAAIYLGQGGMLGLAAFHIPNGPEEFDGPLYLGRDSLGGRYFRGSLDDVRIYDHPLSETDLALVFAAGIGAGRAPNEDDVPGAPLRVDRLPGGDVSLTWSTSCVGSDSDYAVYEGEIGSFTSHRPAVCSTAGATSAVLMPQGGDRYFLVVPNSVNREGSYGRSSAGVRRPPALSACRAQYVVGCD